MKTTGPTYQDLARDIRAHNFAPVYCLMGEESFYIDRLMQLIEQEALNDDERDFNQTILYGAEATAEQIMDAARRYPMMAERQLVVVREAQSMKEQMEHLVTYMQHPNDSTILVICYKHGTMDRRKKLLSAISRVGVVFESNKIWESQLPSFVDDYLKQQRTTIDRSACVMLCGCVGTDLSRMASELDKLILSLPEGVTEIGLSQVADQVGQSKDYNAFELVNALVVKDVEKANRIVNYFGGNPKGFALPQVTATLFTFFSNLLLSYYAPDRSEGGVANFVGVNPVMVRRSLIPAQSRYSGRKVLQIIHYIRCIDAKSKGVDCPSTPDSQLLRDLVYFILH